MFTGIGKILPKSIVRAGIEKQITTVNISDLYNELAAEILPQDMTKKVRPMYVRNKVLLVASLSSIAVQELTFEEQNIIDKINKKLGKNVLEKIRYVA